MNTRWTALPVAVVLTAGLLTTAGATTAAAQGGQLLFTDAFTGATTSAPVVPVQGGAFPCLTAGTSSETGTTVPGCATSPIDSGVPGALRLTDAGGNEESGLLFKNSVPTAAGLSITFDEYQYGGGSPDADGISFFIEAAPTSTAPPPTTIGPFGGHLGYSAGVNNNLPLGSGLPNGYLGIGFDAYGNYGSTNFDGTGCSYSGSSFNASPKPGYVTVRGPGNGSAGYCILSQAQASVAGGPTRADAKRAVSVTIDPAGTYTVGLDPAGGSAYQTVVTGNLPMPVPARIFFGFAGSTGSYTDVHEITDLSASTLTAAVPAFTLMNTDSVGGTVAPGGTFTTTLTPALTGAAAETLPSTIQVTDPLPAGLTAGAPTGANWDCSASSPSNVSCTYTGTGAIGAGTSLSPISVPVTVAQNASGQLANTATVGSADAAAPVPATDTITVQGAGQEQVTLSATGPGATPTSAPSGGETIPFSTLDTAALVHAATTHNSTGLNSTALHTDGTLQSSTLMSSLMYSSGLNSTGLNSTGLNSTGLNSTGLNSTGLNSTGLNSTGLNSTALYGSMLYSVGLYSTGLNSTGLNSTGLNSTGLYSTGLNSTGLNSTGLNSTGLYSTGSLYGALLQPITLNTIALQSSQYPGITWSDVLAGTPFATKPLQDVDLLSLFNFDALNPPSGPNDPYATFHQYFDSLHLGDIDWSQTKLAKISLAALLIGQVPLADLPAPTNGWCAFLQGQPVNCASPGWVTGGAQDTLNLVTLFDLELGNDDLSAYYSSPISLAPKNATLSGTLPLTTATGANLPFEATIASIPLVDVNLAHTPFNGYTVPPTATTLGDLISQVPIGAANGYPGLADITLQELLPGLFTNASTFDYTGASFDELLAASPPRSTNLVTYRVGGTNACVAGAPTETVMLPDGSRYEPGSATVAVGTGSPTPIPDPLVSGTTLTFPGTAWHLPACTSGTQSTTVMFMAEPGGALGPEVATATLTDADGTTTSPPASLNVVDGQGSDALPGTPLSDGALYSGYITAASGTGSVQYWTVPAPAPGSRVNISLGSLTKDYDLVVYGPAGTANDLGALRPLTGTPPDVSTVVPDVGPQSVAGTGTAPPQTLNDVPLLTSLPVRAFSTNRGTSPESVTITGRPDEAGLYYTVQVSGYNGAFSTTDPYVLRAQSIAGPAPLPCSGFAFPYRGTPNGASGVTEDALPTPTAAAGATTFILVNEQRMADLYGATATNAMLGKLHAYAIMPNVNGVVIPVELDPGVAAAYQAWDSSPCSVVAANNVVVAINTLVDSLRGGAAGLRFMTIVGSDAAIPQGRIEDLASVSNEQDYATQARFGSPRTDNPLSSALLNGYLLTDDGYYSFAPAPYLGQAVYPPSVAGGRLVETPADISAQLDEYDTQSNGGQLDPKTAFVSGYDFMNSGSSAAYSALTTSGTPAGGQVSAGSSTLLNDVTDPTWWSATDALNGIQSVAKSGGGYAAVYGHYNNYEGESAQGNYNQPGDPLFTEAELEGDLKTAGLNLDNTLLFTMGCHAGLNLPDVLVAGTPSASDATALRDWAQGISSLGGLYAANTGFGYADDAVLAYSARLMAYYAKNLASGTMSVAQAMQFAKDQYLGESGPFGAYDYKALAEATFYGPPNYTIGPNGTIATPPPLPAPPSGAPGVGTTSTALTVTPTFTPVNDPSGVFSHFEASDPALGISTQAAQVTNLRPDLPRLTLPQTTGAGSDLRGFYITGLATTDNTGPNAQIPRTDVPTTSPDATQPDEPFQGVFPSSIASVTQEQTPTGEQQGLVLLLGQMFAGDPQINSGAPTYRTFTQVAGQVFSSPSSDTTPPTLSSVDAATENGTVTFTVTTPDTDVQMGNVLYRDNVSTAWQVADLAGNGNGSWTAGPISLTNGATSVSEAFAQLVDTSGNVGVSADKGFNFHSHDLVQPPTVAAVVTPAPVAVSSSTTLKLTLANPNPTASLSGVALAATTLPTGFTATGAPTTTCGGTATLTGAVLSMTGGTLADGASCTVSVGLTAPPTPGDVTFTTGAVTATEAPNESSTTSAIVSVTPAPVAPPAFTLSATPSAPPALTVDQAAGTVQTFSTTAPAGDSVTFAATNLPPGLGIDATTGVLSGTPTAPGNFLFTVSADDTTAQGTVSLSETIVVNGVAPTLDARTGAPPGAAAGQAYSFTTYWDGLPAPTAYVVSGASCTGTPGCDGTWLGVMPGATAGTAVLFGTPSARDVGSTATVHVVAESTAPGGGLASTPVTFSVPVGAVAAISGTPAGLVTVDQPFPAFSFTVSGTPTPTLTSTGLPPGVSLTGASLTGTPTVVGSYNATVTASNGLGTPATDAFTIVVQGVAPTVAGTPPSPVTPGVAFPAFQFSLSGDPAPTVALESGALPPGLALSQSGQLTGTPTTPGTYPFTVQAQNVAGAATEQVTIVVSGIAPTITGAPPAGTEHASYSFGFTLTGNPAPTVSVTNGSLPTGLTLSPGGVLSGTPAQEGTFSVTVTASNTYAPNATDSFTLTVNGPPSLSGAPTAGKVGTAYGPFTFSVAGTPLPGALSVTSGSLPPGVALNGSTLSGTPTAPGTFSATVTASDGFGSANDAFTIVISGIAPTISGTPPAATVTGLGYGFTFGATGVPAPTFSVASGALPPGITLNTTTGKLSGTAVDSGVFRFAVKATNAYGSAVTPTLTIAVLGVGVDYGTVSITGLSGSPGSYSNSGFLLAGTFEIVQSSNPAGTVVTSPGPPKLPGRLGASPAQVSVSVTYSASTKKWTETVTVKDNSLTYTVSRSLSSDPVTRPTPNGASDTFTVNGVTVSYTLYDN